MRKLTFILLLLSVGGLSAQNEFDYKFNQYYDAWGDKSGYTESFDVTYEVGNGITVKVTMDPNSDELTIVVLKDDKWNNRYYAGEIIYLKNELNGNKVELKNTVARKPLQAKYKTNSLEVVSWEDDNTRGLSSFELGAGHVNYFFDNPGDLRIIINPSGGKIELEPCSNKQLKQ